MPRAIDPKQRFAIVLASDEGKKPTPTFWCKYLTGREQMDLFEYDATIGRAADGSEEFSGGELMKRGYGAVRLALVGWDHMVGPDGKRIRFDPAKLEDVVGLDEVYELLMKMRDGARPSADDLKKLGSPSRSGSRRSVRNAKGARAKKRAKKRRL